MRRGERRGRGGDQVGGGLPGSQGVAKATIWAEIITVLTRYRPIVLELIKNCNACNFTRRRFFGIILKL